MFAGVCKRVEENCRRHGPTNKLDKYLAIPFKSNLKPPPEYGNTGLGPIRVVACTQTKVAKHRLPRAAVTMLQQ